MLYTLLLMAVAVAGFGVSLTAAAFLLDDLIRDVMGGNDDR